MCMPVLQKRLQDLVLKPFIKIPYVGATGSRTFHIIAANLTLDQTAAGNEGLCAVDTEEHFPPFDVWKNMHGLSLTNKPAQITSTDISQKEFTAQQINLGTSRGERRRSR